MAALVALECVNGVSKRRLEALAYEVKVNSYMEEYAWYLKQTLIAPDSLSLACREAGAT